MKRPAQADVAAQQPAATERELRLVLAALMLAVVLASLDQSIVNTALPRMVSELGGLAHISWVVTAFMLTSTISTPLYGKLSDMYGRRTLFLVSIAIFVLASALCGVAQDMTQLVVFRGLQGVGAGGLMTLSQTVIGDLVPPRERGRYQGLFTAAFAVSSVAGPLLGGILTSLLSWRWVFYVNLPVGGLALALILIGLRPAPPVSSHRIDYLGAALLAAATTSALLLLSWGGSAIPWASVSALGLGAGALCLFGLFFLQERRAAEPVIDLRLFRNRTFTIGVLATGAMAFAMLGALVFLPLYFQLVLGLDPARAGMMMLPQIGAMMISSVYGGRLASRYGRAKPFVMLGVGLEVTALSSLAVLALAGAGVVPFLCVLAILGFGMGIGMPNATLLIQSAVDRSDMGVGTATMGFIRSLGGALGVAMSAGVMAAKLGSELAPLGHAIDPRALIEGGMAKISLLPPGLQHAVVDAYRHAIGLSFMLGGAIMFIAFLMVSSLRGGVLPGRANA